ncbi:hypothetical protein HF563_08345 [Acidithiobacillus ferridurans]|nr:hypothetical protein [Acidithiobacillus ferridurans]
MAIAQIIVKSTPKNCKKVILISCVTNIIMAKQKEKTLGNKTTPRPRIITDLSLLFFIDSAILYFSQKNTWFSIPSKDAEEGTP